MSKVVFADEQDDINSLRTKLEGADDSQVAVVVPRENRALANPIAMRLLLRQAESLALDVSLISSSSTIRRIAYEEGLRVFRSPQSFERAVEREPGPLEHTREVLSEKARRVPSILTSLLVVAMVGLALGLAYVFLPSATVTLAPRAEVVSGTVPVVADPGVRSVDAKAGQIPARVVYLLVDASDQAATGEGRGNDVGKSVGVVTFTNRNSQEMIVPVGTIVSTASGIQFRTNTEVRLAPGLGHTGQTQVTAVLPGQGSNVDRQQIVQVEGLLQSYVLVQNEDATAGGGAQGATTVTILDRDHLQAQVLDRAKQEATAKVATMTQGREFLVPESLEFTPLEVTFDRQVGQEAKVLNVQVKARVAATIVNQDDVDEIVQDTWKPTPRQGFQVSAEGVRIPKPEVSKVDGRVVTLAAHAEATTVAQVNVARVQQYARWRTPAEAEGDLARILDVVSPPSVRIEPGWAGRAYRVKVVLDTSGAQASR